MTVKMRSKFLAFLLFLSTSPAHAGAFDIDILNPSTLNGAVPDDVAVQAVKTFGIYFAHRPFQGAVSMFNTNALDLDFEVTMMKIGGGLQDALAASGLASSSTSNTVALPIVKLHIRKAISPAMDMGFSFIYYRGQQSLGGDLKINLSNPEEGLATAIRIGYTYASASLLYLKSAKVLSPEFVMSKKLDSSEPYIGVGGRYITGQVAVPFHLPPLDDFTVTKGGASFTGYAFTGVMFHILGPKGFRLGMEGAYDVSGFSSIGTIFGMGF